LYKIGDSRNKVVEYEDTLGELLLINPPPNDTPALCPFMFIYAESKIITNARFFFISSFIPLTQT